MAALRAAVFPLSAKNRRGGHFLPPPSSARVNPRLAGGGAYSAPLSNIRDNLRTTQDIATKLSVPYWTSI